MRGGRLGKDFDKVVWKFFKRIPEHLDVDQVIDAYGYDRPIADDEKIPVVNRKFSVNQMEYQFSEGYEKKDHEWFVDVSYLAVAIGFILPVFSKNNGNKGDSIMEDHEIISFTINGSYF